MGFFSLVIRSISPALPAASSAQMMTGRRSSHSLCVESKASREGCRVEPRRWWQVTIPNVNFILLHALSPFLALAQNSLQQPLLRAPRHCRCEGSEARSLFCCFLGLAWRMSLSCMHGCGAEAALCRECTDGVMHGSEECARKKGSVVRSSSSSTSSW